MIEKINNTYKLICNSCGEIFEEDLILSMMQQIIRKVMVGRDGKGQGNWDGLSDCVEFEKDLRR